MEKTLLYLNLQKETENNDAPGIVKAKSNIKTEFVDVIVKNRSQKAA
jgi:hypothetical protein